MDWDCWSRAFSAIHADPSDAKRELKEFHHRVIATRLIIVSHETSAVSRDWGSFARDRTKTTHDSRGNTNASSGRRGR